MCSTFGATNSNMITGPRIYFAVARDGLVPRWIQHIHPTRQTPANSIIIQAVWTVILILWFTGQAMLPATTVTPAKATTDPATLAPAAPVDTSKIEKPKTLKDAFDGLTDSVICAGLIFYSLAVGAVYVLRMTQPNLPRPYRTWGYPVTPALLLVAYAGAFISALMDEPTQVFAVIGLIGAGAIYYAWATWRLARVSP
jgi:APA family basic amino acid/polyamine antiporter